MRDPEKNHNDSISNEAFIRCWEYLRIRSQNEDKCAHSKVMVATFIISVWFCALNGHNV